MPIISLNSRVSLQALLKRFVLFYLPIATLFSAALLSSIWLDEQRRVERQEGRESSRIAVAKKLIAWDFSVVHTDLQVIASLPVLRWYVDTGQPVYRDELAKLLLVLVSKARHYDQARYLDASGREIIRINYNSGKPVIVPHEQLQDKSGRYYFQDTIKLNQGEIFVSPLDLNIEHGQLEIPYKPMIRFGTPVFDSAGQRKGVILLNYLGDELLQHFREVMEGGDLHHGMLLNRDGYWLNGIRREDEWGFMLGQNERSFAHDFAEEWRAISTVEQGVMLTKKGLFVYDTIYPLLPGQRSSTGAHLANVPSQQELAGRDYYWKIVSFVPRSALSGAAFYNQPGGRLLLAAAYLLLALAVWIIALVTLSRRQARAELLDALAKARRFGEAMNNVPAYVYLKNKQHQYTYGNRLVLELFKCSAEELPGSGDEKFFPPETVERLRQIDNRVLERGEVTQEEIDVAPGTPNHRVYWEVKHPIYDDNGEIWGLCGISTDITERKDAEQVLALHAELVRQMAEGMVLIRSSDGIIVFANPAFERIFGYGQGELNGKPVAILNAPTEKSPEETAESINAILRRTGVWQGEIENIRKDGARIWCLVSVSTFVHPEHGEVWLSIHQDITERKRIEEALYRSAREIEDLYNKAPCGYHSLDQNGLIVRINHTELEWLGYTSEEVVGKLHISDLLSPGSQQAFLENFPRFIKQGYIHDLELELVRKDGTLLPVLASATAIYETEGHFVMCRSTLFDLTERKKLEAELQHQARIDELTGLNNRRYFLELAEHELERTRRHRKPLSLLMLDLDYFKLINDNYGHHAGDKVLQKLSEVCGYTLRKVDILGRLGGEEFAIMLPETDGVQALEIAERLRQSIANTVVWLEQDRPIHFTVSIGIASHSEADSGVQELLKRADAALYAAKNAGRNQVCCK